MADSIEITDANFGEITSTNKPALVYFWAEWCGPCIMTSPMVEELAREYQGPVVVGKLDCDVNPNIVVKFGIRSVPTFLILKNGEVVDKQVGAVSKNILANKLDAQLARV